MASFRYRTCARWLAPKRSHGRPAGPPLGRGLAGVGRPGTDVPGVAGPAHPGHSGLHFSRAWRCLSPKRERATPDGGPDWRQPPPHRESTWWPASDAKVCTVDLARMDAHDPMLPPWQFIYDCGHQDLFPEPRAPDEWQRLSTWLEQVWATPCAACAPFPRPADRLPIAARVRRAIQLLVRRARR